MSLFDMVGQVLGSGEGGAGNILAAGQHLLEQNGGVQGLVQKFQQQGLGEVVASWVGNGQNLPISAEQIESVLGQPQIAELAGKFGFDTKTVSGTIAQHLPMLINQLTPNGSVEGGDMLSQGANLLKGFLK
jgi:uncharacterized protein YidB (DUF937 family)